MNQNDKNKKQGFLIFIRKYLFSIIAVIVLGILFFINKDIALKASVSVGSSLKEIIIVLPPIFILLGLLDVWITKERMIRYLGEGSGLKGILIAFIIGSIAAGPLYGAFPVAIVLMKKGAKFSNVLIFIGAWSTTKIPMLLFEISSLGIKFALTRLALSITGILIIAFITNSVVSKEEINKMYEKAEKI